MAVDVDRCAQLSAHPLFDPLALAHRDARGDEAPRDSLVSVGPVEGSNPGKHALQPAHDWIALRDVRPCAAVDVETQDARRLPLDRSHGRLSVDRSMHMAGGVLGQTNADRRPVAVGREREMEMALGRSSPSGTLRHLPINGEVPRVDETGAFPERVAAEPLYLERVRRA